MNKAVNIKLSVMMFLEFLIWEGWVVKKGTYLSQAYSASGGEIALAYDAQTWGAIIETNDCVSYANAISPPEALNA